jgi:hypothetical protein
VLPVFPVFPVDPVAPVVPVAPVSPVEPVAPVGPAGPGTGTAITVAGVTTVGLSHALKASAISTAENTIEYFIRITFLLIDQRKPLAWTGLRPAGVAARDYALSARASVRWRAYPRFCRARSPGLERKSKYFALCALAHRTGANDGQ